MSMWNRRLLRRLLRLGLLAVLLAGIAVAIVQREHLDAVALQAWLESRLDSSDPFGVAMFMLAYALIYAAGTVFFLPGSALTLAGGALFGPAWGTLINLSGATLGAIVAFMIARYLAADWVRERAGKRLQRLIRGVDAEGWRFVAFVRLVPIFPFNLLNYTLGLTGIRLSHYAITSYVCMLPGALAYTYVGYAGREALVGGEGLGQTVLVALALVATVAFVPRILKRMRPNTDADADTSADAADQLPSPSAVAQTRAGELDTNK